MFKTPDFKEFYLVKRLEERNEEDAEAMDFKVLQVRKLPYDVTMTYFIISLHEFQLFNLDLLIFFNTVEESSF